MQIDPSVKKILDIRFAKGELEKDEYLLALQTLREAGSAVTNSGESHSPDPLIWKRFPALCDTNFDGEINLVKEPLSALRQLACLGQSGHRNFFRLIRRESNDSLEVRCFNNTFLLLYIRKSPLLKIPCQCHEKTAVDLLYRLYAEDYQSAAFVQHLESLSLPGCEWQFE